MDITKTTIKNYRVVAVQRKFCKFDEQFRASRLKYHKDKSMCCFKCGYQFQEGDDVGLFAMKSDTNRLGCDNCVTEYLGGE